jgi:YidC/Oxa1 family membrane protein insertase
VSLFALGSLYFMSAVIDRSQIFPTVGTNMNTERNVVFGILSYPRVLGSEDYELQFDGFVGPKAYDQLAAVDDRLTQVIDYGWFGWLAKPLLSLMKWLYASIGNYGIAIIIMTIPFESGYAVQYSFLQIDEGDAENSTSDDGITGKV